MPGQLAFTALDVPFLQGIDGSVDPRMLTVGKLTQANNVVPDVGGRLSVRNGQILVPGTTTADNVVMRLFTSGGTLMKQTPSGVYAFNALTAQWESRVGYPGPVVTTNVLDANAGVAKTAIDCAVAGIYAAYAWSDTDGYYLQVVNTETGAVALQKTSVPQVVRLFAVGAVMYALTPASSTTWGVFSFSTTTGVLTTSVTSLSGATSASAAPFNVADVCVTSDGTQFVLVYRTTITGTDYVALRKYNASLTLMDSGLKVATAAASKYQLACCMANSDADVAIVYNDGDLKMYSVTLAAFVPNFTTTLISPGPAGYKAGVCDAPYPGVIEAVWGVSDTSEGLWHSTVTYAGTAIVTQRTHNITPYSRPFYRLGKVYCVARNVQTIDYGLGGSVNAGTTVVVVDVRCATSLYLCTPVSIIMPANGASLTPGPLIGVGVTSDSNGNAFYTMTQGVSAEVSSTFTVVTSQYTGLVAVTPFVAASAFDFAALRKGTSYRDTAIIAGGWPHSVSGAFPVEVGFAWAPSITSVSSTTTGSTALGPGTYQYAAIYSWTDSSGDVHRSAPSIPVSKTIPDDGNQYTCSVTVSSLTVTSKQVSPYTDSPVSIEVYRTEANGDVFHRADGGGTPAVHTVAIIDNDMTAATSGPYTDGATDEQLRLNPLLYTTGGVLACFPPQSAASIIQHNGRIWSGGGETATVVQYTRSIVAGEAPCWTPLLNVTARRPVGAIASLDDSVAAFMRRGVMLIMGNGPTDAGQQDDLTTALVPTQEGCMNPCATVTTSDGVWFLSSIGIRLLDRGRTVQQTGREMDYLIAQYPTVTDAVNRTEEHEIRFAANDGYLNHAATAGIELAYNTLYKQWLTATRPSGSYYVHSWLPGKYPDTPIYAQAATYYWQAANGRTVLDGGDDTLSDYTHADTPLAIPTTVETGWINFGRMQGVETVQRAVLLGYNDPQSTTTLSIGVNYDTTYAEAVTLSTAATQRQRLVKNQRCQAMRFKIADTGAGTAATTTIRYNGLSIRVGVHPRLFIVPPSATT